MYEIVLWDSNLQSPSITMREICFWPFQNLQNWRTPIRKANSIRNITSKNSYQKSKFLSHYYILHTLHIVVLSVMYVSVSGFFLKICFCKIFRKRWLILTTTWPFLFYRQFFEMTGGISCWTKSQTAKSNW